MDFWLWRDDREHRLVFCYRVWRTGRLTVYVETDFLACARQPDCRRDVLDCLLFGLRQTQLTKDSLSAMQGRLQLRAAREH